MPPKKSCNPGVPGSLGPWGPRLTWNFQSTCYPCSSGHLERIPIRKWATNLGRELPAKQSEISIVMIITTLMRMAMRGPQTCSVPMCIRVQRPKGAKTPVYKIGLETHQCKNLCQYDYLKLSAGTSACPWWTDAASSSPILVDTAPCLDTQPVDQHPINWWSTNAWSIFILTCLSLI